MSLRKQQRLFYVARWTIAGAIGGVAFVLIAWRIGVSELGPVTFGELHNAMPIMWIVDLAPTVLGLIGAGVGVLHLRIHSAYEGAQSAAEQIATAWTADLQRANVKLADALDQRERFYAAFSHELRTPLSSILGYSEMAEELIVEPHEVADYLGEIFQSASFLLEMVNDLLEAAKLSRHGLRIEVSDVDGDSLIADVVGLLQPLASSKDLGLVTDLKAKTECRSDPLRLRQVMTNLIANAVKYSETGVVRVSTRVEAGRFVAQVTDQGAGLSADDIDRIFEPYVQADGVTRRDSTGLGLAVTRAFVEAMDGTVTASSPGIGLGSTFRLELPLAMGVAPEAREAHLVTPRG